MRGSTPARGPDGWSAAAPDVRVGQPAAHPTTNRSAGICASAGAVVVGIATSQPPETLLDAGACCVIQTFEELLAAARAQGVA